MRRKPVKVQIEWNEDKPALYQGMVGQDGWIVCEACGEPIKQKHTGIAVFDFYTALPASPGVHFFHKGQCDPGSVSWKELHLFLAHLQDCLIDAEDG